MVEGHGVHRVAVTHRRALVGKRFAATSPNGKFEQGARAIDGVKLRKVEVIGKNLFYKFGGHDDGSTDRGSIVHVHFGMSGRFGVFSADTAPEVTPNTRLKLEGHGLVALLSAMTVNLIDHETYAKKCQTLGQDPLREDACAETLWGKFSKTRKSVGAALMDQTMFAGVGNIYRAEILYKAGVHPDESCTDLARGTFDALWHHTVELMQRGFVNGSILTVDPEEALVLGEPWTRRYVYNQTSCGRCGDRVKVWDIANRTVYACETCQPLRRNSGVSGQTQPAKGEAKAFVPFVSHCAPDSTATTLLEPSRLTVAQLKAKLEEKGWPFGLKKTAKKRELVAAALAAFAPEKLDTKEKPSQSCEVEAPHDSPLRPPVGVPFTRSRIATPTTPGTKALEHQMNSARNAALEKIAAGEKGNVEHVAAADDETVSAKAMQYLVRTKKKRSERSPAKRRKVPEKTDPSTPDPVEKKRNPRGVLFQ